jgi:hypothetical protein
MPRTTIDLDTSVIEPPSKRMGKPQIDLGDKDALWRTLEERLPDFRRDDISAARAPLA